MEKLTARQEKFCQSIADGMNQTDAYKSAYSIKNKSEKSIWELASRVSSNVKVMSRIAELKAEIAKKQLWTREQSVDVLKKIAESKKQQTRDSDKVSAVKELNSMHGFNSPEDYSDYVLPVRIIREVVDGSKIQINNTTG